jgi:hypothetical protein
MSKLKASYEANLAEMKKAVPEEFWGDLEKEVAAAAPVAVPTEAEQQAAVVAEIKENPSIDDAAILPEVEGKITVPAPEVAPSQADQDAAMAVELKATEASVADGGDMAGAKEKQD